MPDILRWGAELRDTAAEVIADCRRSCERARRLVKESAELRAARHGGGNAGPPGDVAGRNRAGADPPGKENAPPPAHWPGRGRGVWARETARWHPLGGCHRAGGL